MKTFLRWHENFTEKKRKFYKLSHYQAYWVSWIKGLLTGAIVLYFILVG